MRQRIEKGLTVVFLTGIACLVILPLLFIITGSLMGKRELEECIAPILTGSKGYASWHFLPKFPTLRNLVELLFDSPEFFHMFWNTMKITGGILAGQMIFGIPGAWGLARYSFRGKKVIYQLYILLMVMPFQVMMLSEYMVLEKIGKNNTLLAVILPGIFSTFSVFLIYRFFAGIPEEVLDAARVDGAGEFQIFLRIGLPMGAAGIFSALTLQFLECFSMVEQPITFLKDRVLWPLSLYIPEIGIAEAGTAFCASLVGMLPALLVFYCGKDYLEQGIVAFALKE